MKVLRMARRRASGIRVTVRISLLPDLLAYARARAAAEGIGMGDLVERVIRAEIGRRRAQPAVTMREVLDGLPMLSREEGEAWLRDIRGMDEHFDGSVRDPYDKERPE
jgi:hypothetical protein